MGDNLLFTNFAKLLTYPDDVYSVYCRTALSELQKYSEENFEKKENLNNAIAKLEIFISEIATKTLGEREEIFTQSFDINPIGNLEVGWHLYGEQYERGAFLVMCRELLRKLNIEESVELPDHLSHLLILVGLMSKEEATKFTEKYILLALEKIILKFSEKENIYENLLQAIKIFLIAKFEIGEKQYV